MDIDVYHCPNCDVVQGPSLSEWLPPSRNNTSSLLNLSCLTPSLCLGWGGVEGHSAEFFLCFGGGMGRPLQAPEAKH